MLRTDYPVASICEALDCTRSARYYQAKEPAQTELIAAIEAVVVEWPTYGYRRVTAQLRGQEWVVNHKRVQRLMQEMGLQVKIKRKTRKATNSGHSFPRYPNRLAEPFGYAQDRLAPKPGARPGNRVPSPVDGGFSLKIAQKVSSFRGALQPFRTSQSPGTLGQTPRRRT